MRPAQRTGPARPPSQTWRPFLRNHAHHLWAAADLLTVPTLTFKTLYVLVFLAHGRRELVHVKPPEDPGRTHRDRARYDDQCASGAYVLKLTGVGSRFAVTVTGVTFLVLACVPKLGALIAATPDPVVGGIVLPAAGSLILTGVVTLARSPDTPRHATVAGLAVVIGTGLPPMAANLASRLPAVAVQLLSQPVVANAIRGADAGAGLRAVAGARPRQRPAGPGVAPGRALLIAA